jgi:hypothetical protein
MSSRGAEGPSGRRRIGKNSGIRQRDAQHARQIQLRYGLASSSTLGSSRRFFENASKQKTRAGSDTIRTGSAAPRRTLPRSMSASTYHPVNPQSGERG